MILISSIIGFIVVLFVIILLASAFKVKKFYKLQVEEIRILRRILNQLEK